MSNKALMRKLILFAVMIFWTLIPLSGEVFAASYYVDSLNGFDLNAGDTPATAWKTIAKVSRTNFQPGDIISFKRGQFWREQLEVPASGNATQPITFTAYGTGSNPVVKGSADLGNSNWVAYGASPPPPPPVNQLTFVNDIFDRSDQLGWGKATSGVDSNLKWNGATNSWKIASGKGVMNSSWGGRYNYIGDMHNEDLELYVEMSNISKTSDNRGSGVIFRNNGSNNYRVSYQRSNSTLILHKWNPNVHDMFIITVPDYSSCNLRVKVIKIDSNTVNIKARIWSGTEPQTWDIDYNDANNPLTSGNYGIVAYNSNPSTYITLTKFSVQQYSAQISNTEQSNTAAQAGTTGSTFYKTLTSDPGQILSEDGRLLSKVSSIDATVNTPGSYYWTSNTIYVHPSDGSDPNTNGKLYEVPARMYCIDVYGKNYVTISDITVEHSRASGIQIQNRAAHVTIKDVVARQCGWFGIAWSTDGGAGSFGVCQGCTAYENKMYGGIGHTCYDSWIVEDNTCYNNGVDNWRDHGIYVSSNSSANSILRRNKCYNNAANGIKIASASTGFTVSYNLTYNNGRSGYYADQGSSGTNFYNNVDIGSRNGLFVYSKASVDNVINNIFRSAKEYGVIIGSGARIGSFQSNAVHGAGIRNYNGMTDPTGSEGNISANPQFTDEPNRVCALQPTSPCIDGGTPVGYNKDFYGTPVPQGPWPDIGLSEFSH
jgi:hypothetical protein